MGRPESKQSCYFKVYGKYLWGKCGLMCTQITQMNTCHAVKLKWHNCGLNPQMWIIVAEYHEHIYDNFKNFKPFFTLFFNLVPTIKILNEKDTNVA